ncbi:MAG: DUF2399 domain-containing protein [Bacillota bacterium]|nr:DUF2399 domain-containing protein [Bacillota bacterium]
MWTIYRETARKAVVEGYFFTGCGEDPGLPPQVTETLVRVYSHRHRVSYKELLLQLAPASVNTGTAPDLLIDKLTDGGWLTLWQRLNPDGVTVREILIGPGALLQKALEARDASRRRELKQWWDKQSALYRKISEQAGRNAEDPGSPVGALLRFVDDQLSAVEQALAGAPPPQITISGTTCRFGTANTGAKYARAVEFCLALARSMCTHPEGFDWKEIGAAAGHIGASKYFDGHKEALITLAEEITGAGPDDWGLLSSGRLYSIYLAGPVIHHPNPGTRPQLYALTNVQAAEMTSLCTERIGTVLVTENRAVLLKMYKSGWLEERRDFLVVGIDGQVRRGHRRFLTMLAGTGIAFYAWMDTDPAGAVIAAHLNEIIPACRFVLPIGNPPDTLHVLSYDAWRAQLDNRCGTGQEQEAFLGDPALWNTLFR